MGKYCNFKIQPGGLKAKAPTKFAEGQAKAMLREKPTDENQRAPSVEAPIRRAAKMAGGG